MGAICDILTERKATRMTLRHPAQWFLDWAGVGDSSSGVSVSHSSSLKHSPFWAAVRVISGTIAALPFLVYERLPDGGKQKLPGHRVDQLLHVRPNEYMDTVTFIETRQAHVLTYGNGYAEIQRDGAGRPVALWPLLPHRTTRKLSEEGVPYYEVQVPSGERINLPDYNVLHVKGLGFDGYTGYDVVAYHKETIGYGMAVKEYGARFFGSGANVGGVIEHPQSLTDKAKKSLKESLKLHYEGLGKSHRTMILEEGMKFNKTGIEPEKAQALETQKWTVDDCSRIFQIPPHKIGSMEFSKYNNVEQLQIDFICTTMLYWFRKWETECSYKLFMPAERSRLFCEILFAGLLRGDVKSRYEAYNIGRNAGFLCVDDIRGWENLNPLPDGNGQIFLEPLNMKPAGEPEPDGDAARQALLDILTSQFRRVIIKQQKGANGSGEWAYKILREPVTAYARGLGRLEMAERALSAAVVEFVQREEPLNESDTDRFANRITQLLGGNHNAGYET